MPIPSTRTKAQWINGELSGGMLELYERATNQQITTSASMADSYKRGAM